MIVIYLNLKRCLILSNTIFDKYIQSTTLNTGVSQKIYDGYHEYRGLKIVHNLFSLINWDNNKLKIPKSTYSLSTQDFFKNLVPKNLTEDKENLKDVIMTPDDFFEIDGSKYLYNGKIINLMLKINGNTKFPYQFKINTSYILCLYKLTEDKLYKFQGMICPIHKNTKGIESYVKIKSL
jgi:hypothetical protein